MSKKEQKINKEYLRNIPISKIKANPRNPRNNDKSVKHVTKSMEEVGYITPIIVDGSNMILAGHTRIKSLQEQGIEIVPEVLKVTGLSEKQKKKFMLADNSAGQSSEWNLDILKELDMTQSFLQDIGIKEIDIKNMFNMNEEIEKIRLGEEILNGEESFYEKISQEVRRIENILSNLNNMKTGNEIKAERIILDIIKEIDEKYIDSKYQD